jgi:4-amino-4-deoxy-L-arabinose transferase-like glycosyltransferase
LGTKNKIFMKIKILLIVTVCISLLLSLYKLNEVPPCLNSDEIAYGYNAYSIMTTGADEHGNFLPLRLRSFEDYKLPLYTYILIPFIKVFGVNDFAVRAPNILLAALFPLLFYAILKKIFDARVGVVGAFLVSISPWIYLLSRQAHEGVLCAFLILLGINALLSYQQTDRLRCFVMGNSFVFLSAFAYHPGRIFLVVIGILQVVSFWSASDRIPAFKLRDPISHFMAFQGDKNTVDTNANSYSFPSGFCIWGK